MNWDSVIQAVSPHIVKIDTPTGSGTGFLCAYNEDKTFCCVATANHVVADTDEWQQPLRLTDRAFQKTMFLKASERVIFTSESTDTAVILVPPKKFDFPKEPIPLRPIETPLTIGVEVGWLGYRDGDLLE